ncbi:MAG: Threonylcarbamoyl-AMP synthase [candidate division WS6 bacterium OLB20]|uniref:L-threonylcarbamoyladenylate synthase n=1 Tax=candidate division WS6 bacterium OLB20 TaxID=1617426 RepID=A0A136LZ72_9BACT|nr:MAG: Threonylcarbamoyl-AMP synthase [candidate division WS6 bacterium OLB20]
MDSFTETQLNMLQEAARVLREGGLVVFPTETAYGAGVAAENPEAVSKLLEFKRRPEGKAISVAVADRDMAERYVELNDEAKTVYRRFLPGPLTVISKSRGLADSRLESEHGTLGIRIPDFSFTLELIRLLGEGISATSANSAGRATPYSPQAVYDNVSLKQKRLIDYMIDFGELPKRPTSTVIDTTTHDLQIVRSGAILPGLSRSERDINTPEDMQKLGSETFLTLASRLNDGPLIVLFNAEMGAGKTQFVKGIAAAMGISETVTSPTFNLIQEYEHDGLTLAHIDAWRMNSNAELSGLNLEQYFRPHTLIAVEWAGALQDLFEQMRVESAGAGVPLAFADVEIAYTGQNTRHVIIHS